MDIFKIIWPEFPVIQGVKIGIAKLADAEQIGHLSRRLIETGISEWAWTPDRVARQIRNPNSLVLLGRDQQRLIAFAIMEFREKAANLALLGVEHEYRRSGVGGCLVKFLEKSAFVLGNSIVTLEVRANNKAAKAFYRALNYHELELLFQYYSNFETAVRMVRYLPIKPLNQAWAHDDNKQVL